MHVNVFTIFISMIVCLAIVALLSGSAQWGILAALVAGVGSFKWLRIKKQEAADELEYDERVNQNIKAYSFQTFSIANLLLLVYLLISWQILKVQTVNANYLILYLSITFIAAFYIVPFIARKK